jgi:hypothetical protein
MRIGRALIIPAILAFGLAGSLLTGSAMSAAVAQAPSVQVHVTAATANPNMFYHA